MRILPITYSMNSHCLYLDISQELFKSFRILIFFYSRYISHNILFNIQYIEKAFTMSIWHVTYEYDGWE